jgi:hypothetical protein
MQRVRVRMHDPEAHIWVAEFETSLPRDLIEFYLAAHGPAGLGASLLRLEEKGESRDILCFAILPFVHEQEFVGKGPLEPNVDSPARSLELVPRVCVGRARTHHPRGRHAGELARLRASAGPTRCHSLRRSSCGR